MFKLILEIVCYGFPLFSIMYIAGYYFILFFQEWQTTSRDPSTPCKNIYILFKILTKYDIINIIILSDIFYNIIILKFRNILTFEPLFMFGTMPKK
jgi:hypothetical protein